MQIKQSIKELVFTEYGHPSDLEILLPLDEYKSSEDVKAYFVKLWPKIRQQTIALCGSHFHVTEGSCRKLYELSKDVENTLHIDSTDCKIHLYTEEGYHINSYTLRDKEAYYVSLTTGSVDRLSEEELKFLIGHELGHLLSGHIEYHLLLAYLPETVRFGLRVSEVGHNLAQKSFDFLAKRLKKNDGQTEEAIKNKEGVPESNSGLKKILGIAGGVTRMNLWNRTSEYTADRIGLLACQDINVALSALMKISGLPQTYYKDASIEEFIKQAHEFNETYGGGYDSLLKQLDVLDEDHPWLIRRANELLKWYNTEYKNFILES